MTKPYSFWIALVLSGLSACGGGGGGSGDGGATPDPGPGVSGNGDPVAQALASGNSKAVSLSDLAASTQTLLSGQTANYGKVKQALFGLNADGSANANSLNQLSWNPTHDSSWLNILDRARNQVVLPANWSYQSNAAGSGVSLAVVGTDPASGSRYAAFGGNPMGVPGNAAMDAFLVNTVSWLTPRSAAPASFRIVTAHLPGTETYWFPFEGAVRSWFANHYAGVTINGKTGSQSQADNLCDGSALDGCLQNADLLVIGREQGPNAYDGAVVMRAVTAAQARGIPVLYLHHYRDANDLASRLLGYFGLSQTNNYWDIEGLQNFDPSTLPAVPAQLAGFSDLLNRLVQGRFSTSWSGCSSSGRISCSADATYMAEFGALANQLRSSLRQLDANGTAIFGLPGYDLEKRLALLGDKFREAVAYPLDKVTNEQDFFRALFSDVTAYVHRPYSAVATNLGNFSGLFPAGTPTASHQLSVALPSSGSKDTMTGLYVMPGSTVKLSRSDSSGATVTFGLNMLRDTTWAFNTNGLDRPTQISSPRMPLAAGRSVSITSPYGGPLFLFISAAAGSTQTVTVQVDGAITHPVLRDATDPAQVSAFQSEVASTPTNWVGITSDTLTLHSTLDHMRQTMSSYNNDMARLASDTWTYTIKDTYELAGFNSASGSFTLAPAVSAFCTGKNWDCTGTQHRRDLMQHVISDVHAACGDGCSGNPYDQDWPFGPLGWGESHEIGHNIQPGRLRIYDGQSGEVSNNIFPMHKQMHYNESPAGQSSPISSRAGAVKSSFAVLKQALAQSNPSSAAYNAIWSDTSYAADNDQRVTFYRQLAEYARYYNTRANNNFSDGWELFTLLYLLDRNFGNSSGNWSSVAASYGFGTYSSYPAGISANDFMLIATSYIIGRDMRPAFDLWGITYSSTAASQVAAYGYAAAAQLLFPIKDLTSPPSAVGQPVAMSSTATYPAGY